ncbi:polyhydroxyalkanoate synthase [Novosphingobium sp. CF614]|uniref:PHA/PHB synthase family protein n=1 Tax=Novosphingobium sp. CF614 TaxID=1884364 RepID=UPI0008E6DF2C|nr:alpha/beta fold hydrolase [Novosphingobium sp. CF614]SFF91395.1 polyhydroxyalkanoate synthase [Novosphingobium sp. CF614]
MKHALIEAEARGGGPPGGRIADPAGEGPVLLAGLDQRFHALEGRLTGGVAPMAVWMAMFDWSFHLLNAPGRRIGLAMDAARQLGKLGAAAFGSEEIAPTQGDHRFTSPAWRDLPFSLVKQAFLLCEQWADRATSGVPGVTPANERIVNFTARQWLDMFSPSNLPWLNPEVIQATWNEQGQNLGRGARNYLNDLAHLIGSSPASAGGEAFVPGKQVAITPGKVVFRNDLIELIQYAPASDRVRAEPVLIAPAWIMKYYILDLSPHNSLIRYLTEQGHTVFCISWRNPGAEMRDTPFDAYRSDGFMAALDAVGAICGDARVHACGYCLGGTLLAIAAAAMARDGDERLASVTLFAAQTDFTEAGELQLFTTEAQIAFLDDIMATRGFLDGRQMGGAFQLLQSRDLIWSRLLKSYWLGETDAPNDLMAWNEDATRMPARMHTEYLRAMFLHDDLSEGRYLVEGRPVVIEDIRVPFFVVGTETDHVAPWRSVFKIHLLNPGEVTFVLTSGGHNAGIVSEPGHAHRQFRMATRMAGEAYASPDAWSEQAPAYEGSWWPAWTAWLAERSSPQDRAPPSMGAPGHGFPPLEDAPGRYVLER